MFRFATLFLAFFTISLPLYSAPSATFDSFSCPKGCGEWGSPEIQELEYGFMSLCDAATRLSFFLFDHSQPYTDAILDNDLPDYCNSCDKGFNPYNNSNHYLPTYYLDREPIRCFYPYYYVKNEEEWKKTDPQTDLVSLQFTDLFTPCHCDDCFFSNCWYKTGNCPKGKQPYPYFDHAEKVEKEEDPEYIAKYPDQYVPFQHEHYQGFFHNFWAVFFCSKPSKDGETVTGCFFSRCKSNYLIDHGFGGTNADDWFIEAPYLRFSELPHNWFWKEEDGTLSPPLRTNYRLDRSVDCKQILFDIDQELLHLRNDVHGLGIFPSKDHLKRAFDGEYERFTKHLQEIKARHRNIFSSCAKNHRAPSALYELALFSFDEGDHIRALDYMEEVFERTNIDELQSHLASTLCCSQGSIQNEIALYDQALLSLRESLDYKPHNKKACLETALTLFEKGEFAQSAEAYLQSKHSLNMVDGTTTSLMDFSTGLIQGITKGATATLANFIPSMCSSLSGLSHGLWAFACSPKEVSQEMIYAAQSVASFLSSHTTLETFQTLIPELKELVVLPPNEHRAKGKIIGTMIGKYGVELLASFGTVKAIKLYRQLKKANGTLTLHTLNNLEKKEKVQTISRSWWKKTVPVIEEMKGSGGQVGDKLYKAFRQQNLNELQVRRILHRAGFQTFPKPKGIPSSSTVKISKNGGGMVYVKAGTTREESILIRVMPGNPKSSNLMQRKPYVVQRRGKEAVAKGGSFVDPLTSEAHIPLEEFEFKGW